MPGEPRYTPRPGGRAAFESRPSRRVRAPKKPRLCAYTSSCLAMAQVCEPWHVRFTTLALRRPKTADVPVVRGHGLQTRHPSLCGGMGAEPAGQATTGEGIDNKQVCGSGRPSGHGHSMAPDLKFA